MKINFKLLIRCILLTLISATTLPGQTTEILQATKDNTIHSENNNSNALGDLFAGRTGVSNGGNLRRALIRFSLALVPTNATITSVTLTLTKNKGGSGNTSLHKLTSDWGEGTSFSGGGGPGNDGGGGALPTTGDATWNHTFYNTQNWGSSGGDFIGTASASTSVTANGQYNWSTPGMVSDVQNWLNNSTTNDGWIIRGDESTNGTASRFNSREDASGFPVLLVEYTVPTCQDTVMLSGIIAPNTYQAAKLIQSDGTIQSPSIVVFDTGMEAILEDEFSVLLGAEFEIKIGGCTN